MPRYKVLHAYRSNDYGPFEKGTQIELDAAEAAWINKDSPGTLDEVDPEAQATAKRERRAAESAKRAAEKKARVDPEAEAKSPAAKKTGAGDGST